MLVVQKQYLMAQINEDSLKEFLLQIFLVRSVVTSSIHVYVNFSLKLYACRIFYPYA